MIRFCSIIYQLYFSIQLLFVFKMNQLVFRKEYLREFGYAHFILRVIHLHLFYSVNRLKSHCFQRVNFFYPIACIQPAI
jgi:hypothetical protein